MRKLDDLLIKVSHITIQLTLSARKVGWESIANYVKMKRLLIVLAVLVFACNGLAQQRIAIWPGAAPGSESWGWQEEEDSVSIPGDPLAYNIVRPELVFFPAPASTANGKSVIVCPGGSFCYLHIKTEGTDVARWLNNRGFSAFVLKYRVVHSETDRPMQEKNERAKDTLNALKLLTTLVPMAIEDGRRAIAYVRQHAAELGVSPDKIGIMGFSAGGALASAGCFGYTSANRPDFAAPIYAYVPPLLAVVPTDAPPLFIAAATDDDYHMVPMSIGLYEKWLATGHSAEIHIYSKGGHGFGMNRQNQPSDGWIDRFGDWLNIQHF